ncbi:MAG: hypothetical protein HOQ28_20510 [Thermoleophilia bacterium]|nr:hypothetical protein [Thermoleophilia bacterium]
MTRLALAAILALLLLGAVGCGSNSRSESGAGKSSRPSTTDAAGSQLTDLRDIDQLRSLFNRRSGQPRLILLASPT